MNYGFYGSNTQSVYPINEKFKNIKDQRHLYELMLDIWCSYSCAPRLREKWNENNKTVGQCSITAFLVQDIFGGEVYGVPLKDGGFHCFNKVGKIIFDLTSEQFGNDKLDYTLNYPQTREEHFSKLEKKQRYEYIVNELKRKIGYGQKNI